MNAHHAMTRDLLGIDGCKGGWYAVVECGRTGRISTHVFTTFDALLAGTSASALIAVDVPIGLADDGRRVCDQEARRLLGAGRSSSVFSPPARATLYAETYTEACSINEAQTGVKISLQAFHIRQKIAQVDEALRASVALRERVFEVHPEVCFMQMRREAGGADKEARRGIEAPKRSAEGFALRRSLLAHAFGDAVDRALDDREAKHVARDDILDAFATLWTARRIREQRAFQIPATLPEDAAGLRMTITC